MVRICFVCLGNICRSPTAEGTMQGLVAQEGLEDSVVIESAGTSGAHIGERPDRRSRSAASSRGVVVNGRAQQFTADDFDRFDHVLAADSQNRRDLLALARTHADRSKVKLLLDFAPGREGEDVPDPYYGGGFEGVLDLCEIACKGLLAHLRATGAI